MQSLLKRISLGDSRCEVGWDGEGGRGRERLAWHFIQSVSLIIMTIFIMNITIIIMTTIIITIFTTRGSKIIGLTHLWKLWDRTWRRADSFLVLSGASRL